jgi:hypothetical protein
MTEAKWLSWPDPYDLLEQCLICELTERRLRLFACACCRRLWDRLEDDRLRVAIAVAEQFADSQATPEELEDARKMAANFLNDYILYYWADDELVAEDTDPNDLSTEERDAIEMALERRSDADEEERRWAVRHAAVAVVAASSRDGDDGKSYLHQTETVILETSQAQANFVGWHAERHLQANLLRDIFGNPYRQPSLKSNWILPTVIDLARSIHSHRAYDRMAMLGDALEEAGCDNADVLSHCRSGTEHVRGCWVIDAILGRS